MSIDTLFRAVARHDASSSVLDRELVSRREAEAAAELLRDELQRWIDTEYSPEVLALRREHAAQRGEDPAGVEPQEELATVEVECLRYRVGDDDIEHDPVAQAIVEAVIDTPLVRWPASRDGARADRPMRLLFADVPVAGQWAPMDLGDSEQMLAWFAAHDLTYPDAARRARKHARWLEAERVRAERELQCARESADLGPAIADVERLERELAAAREALAAAQRIAERARERRDINIRQHAVAMARRIPV
ncbi:hypothetical protein ABXN37_22415 [Piscinibacter sakaiensis]|uniref:Uncharacterized protein n=1 Tax=Piscinibacter sakaiensis TaxID=1547922 RepID=A0A0K8P5L2_PISS1|nr:hypothetical protein [Piscinibacter sakaiensis]GAP37881.1 hypothetical protein ISF6_4075 [Piscinibacter sakaiensis]